MKIGIIGAGFTGLTSAYRLLQAGHDVTIFEKDSNPGGLAIGYQEDGWEWTLEQHYHHWFTNDTFILNLAKEIGYPVIITRPKTSVFLDNTSYQLDSPLSFLTFPKLPFLDRLRMIFILGLLRIDPFWQPLEKINANKFLTKAMGKKAYQLLWEPQLRNKMGTYADDVSLVWFWSRIKKRTSSLAYPAKGFLPFAHTLVQEIEKKGRKVLFNSEIKQIESREQPAVLYRRTIEHEQKQMFDKIIVTLPTPLFVHVTPQLPESYKASLIKLQGLGATNMVLRLKKPFLKDKTYWLSICEKDSPIMVIVEHTHFIDKKYYNNEHIVYLGNYLPKDSEKFAMTKEELFSFYDTFLEKIHPGYKDDLIDYQLFKAPFAQPIVPQNYSKHIPPFTTPLPHIFLANMQQVYPWDRGTNYAVELGEKIATIVEKNV